MKSSTAPDLAQTGGYRESPIPRGAAAPPPVGRGSDALPAARLFGGCAVSRIRSCSESR